MARIEERVRKYYTPGTAAQKVSTAPQIEYPTEKIRTVKKEENK